jgi:hypothetical protein
MVNAFSEKKTKKMRQRKKKKINKKREARNIFFSVHLKLRGWSVQSEIFFF